MLKSVLAFFLSAVALGSAAFAAPIQESTSDAEWGPWSVLLPLDCPGGGKDVATVLSPEKAMKTLRLGGSGPDFSRKRRGKDGYDIQWKLARTSEVAAPDTEMVDFLALMPESYKENRGAVAAKAAAFAHRTFDSPRDQRLAASFGSDDGCRVWLNGKLILEKAVARGLDPTNDPLVLDLKAGINHLFVKVCNEGGAWSCQLIKAQGPEKQAPPIDQKAINEAINNGVSYLMQCQNLDGSWSHVADPYRNGQTALSVYALLKGGLPESHQAVRRGIEFLRTSPPKKTYSAACQILALVSTNNDEHTDWILELADSLADWQEQGFGYPSAQTDLSNTQYGALGLWTAQKVGFKTSDRTWLALLREALNHQNEDGGFGYRLGEVSTGSMTTAGLTIVAICRDGFGSSGFPSQVRKRAETSTEEGLQWLADNFQSDKNPKGKAGNGEQWKHYYLYGLERLAALLKIKEIGPYDWYRQGSNFYVRSQGAEGQWSTKYGADQPNTAFGVLFLGRGTASLTGVKLSKVASRTYVTEAAKGDVVMRASGDSPLNLWLSEFPEATLERYSQERTGGFGLYIDRVEYVADGELVETVTADPTKAWSSEKFATRYQFPKRGKHTVQVRTYLAGDPLEPTKAPTVLESPLLEVSVNQLMEDWMLQYPADELLNLALGERATATSTSMRNGGRDPKFAFDGLMGTAWISAQNDPKPTLSVEFRRGFRADRVVLSHASSTLLWRNHFDRATKVEVWLGPKRGPFVFDVDANEEHKSVLILPRTAKITDLSIHILESESGTKWPGSVGFSEVELRLGD